MINVLLCCNKNYFDGVLTCALSILMRTQSTEPFKFFIYTMDVSHRKPEYVCVSDSQIDFFNSIIKKYNTENIAEKFDVTDLYKREFSGCPNEDAYCSPYTLLRLLADEVEGMPDKILYLDVDVLFNGEIQKIYNIDIEDYEYAAARDQYGKYLLGPNYINAGVLLLNLKRIKETGLFKKARELLRRKKLLFADQSALIRNTTKRKILPQRFNDQGILMKKTVIRHFAKRLFLLPYPHTENIKPWHVTRIHQKFRYSAFDDVLYEYIYLKKTFENLNGEN